MYTNSTKAVAVVAPVSTKYTQYVQKLDEDHIKKVITPTDNSPIHSLTSVNRAAKPLPKAKAVHVAKNLLKPSPPNNLPNKITQTNHTESKMARSITPGEKKTKFSEIFSPEESNALQLYILQKAGSAPNMEDVITSEEDEEGMFTVTGDTAKSPSSKRRRSADQLVTSSPNNENYLQLNNPSPTHHPGEDGAEDPFSNKLRTSSESIANIVYSSIRPDMEGQNEFDTNLPTGSDSKLDYDPHEPMPNMDQLALRHELLNNIRAISRATYFEDLYTGKVSQNDGPPEAEILHILQNSDGHLSQDDRERVEVWVRDSIQNSNSAPPKDRDEAVDLDDEPGTEPPRLHHWKPSDEDVTVATAEKVAGLDITQLETQANANYRTFRNTEDSTNIPPLLPAPINPVKSLAREKRPYSFSQHDTVPASTLITTKRHLDLAPTPTPRSTNAVVTPLLASSNNGHNSLPSFSRHLPKTNEREVGLQVQRLQKLQQSKPHPPSYPVRKLVPSQNSSNSSSVVSMSTSLPNPKGMPRKGHIKHYDGSNTSKYNKIPRIYQRQNMNQWVAKKVWFYMNGDDRFPRIEYRFRPRDLQTMDNLLNLLNKKMPQLTKGARFVFRLDGRPINSVDELQNEQGYVVSSVRKFKVR